MHHLSGASHHPEGNHAGEEEDVPDSRASTVGPQEQKETLVLGEVGGSGIKKGWSTSGG